MDVGCQGTLQRRCALSTGALLGACAIAFALIGGCAATRSARSGALARSAQARHSFEAARAYAEAHVQRENSGAEGGVAGESGWAPSSEIPVASSIVMPTLDGRASVVATTFDVEELPSPNELLESMPVPSVTEFNAPLVSEGELLEVDRPAPMVPAPRTKTAMSGIPRSAKDGLVGTQRLTESEMISWALANSPVIRPLGLRIVDQPGAAVTIYDRAITQNDPFFGTQAALAEFDSRLSAVLDTQNNDRVFNNATLGGNVQELTQDFANLNLGWQKRTLNGATVGVNGVTLHDSNNRQANIFPSYWERQLEASIRQPLARGAGRSFNLIAGPNAQPGFNFSNGVYIARLNNQISDADFDISLRRFIRDLYTTYWDLAGKYESFESIKTVHDQAHVTWQATLAKRASGLEGGEANREAEARAKYYRYQRDLEISLGGPDGLYVTERRLRQLMGIEIVDDELLQPASAPSQAPVTFEYTSLVSESFANRTELKRQAIRVQQQQMRLTAAKNFLLPQVDVIGRYRLRGFGDDLYGDGPRFSSANQDFFSLDHQEWQFGLEMGQVVGRRQAHAAVNHAKLQLQREQAILVEQQREIEHQVSDAYAAVASTYAAMLSSEAQLEAAQTRVQSSMSLFEAGKLQIEFLLDAQEELLQASQTHIADRVRYNLTLVDVMDATGRLLTESGVHMTACPL